MKIGIIVHSQTGHTLSVAEAIQEKLIKSGHTVTIERVVAAQDDQPEASKVELRSIPDVSIYDGIIFGAPVRAFSLSVIMIVFLTQIWSLEGKKVFCYLTQQLPYPWMGGKHAMKQMIKLCKARDGVISGTGIINWSVKDREQRIITLADEFDRLFQ